MAGRHSASSRDNDPAAGSRPGPPHARHAAPQPGPSPKRRPRRQTGGGWARSWRRTAFTGAAVCAAAVTVVVAASWPNGSGHNVATASSGCTGEESLRVIAAPAVAPAITRIATKWQATHPAVHSICVFVSVTPNNSSDAEQSLLGVTNATLWIPDSTVWSSRLATDAPALGAQLTVGQSVAKSPLVIAVSPARAASVAAAARKGLSSSLTSAGSPVRLADPTVTTDGALGLVGLQAQLGATPAGRDALGSVFLQLTGRILPNTTAGFAALSDFPTSAPSFVTSEQEVIAANHGRFAPVATAVYPSGTTAALDFPLVAITPSHVHVYDDAERLFAQRLTQPDAIQALNAVGLRDAAGAPITRDPGAVGADTEVGPLAPASTATSLTDLLRRWVAAGAPNQFLTVIDVSGSMKDDSGNHQTKISVASQAAAAAVTLMPDAWSVGLWTFSVNPPPANDWTERVPLAAVKSNRDALRDAANALPSQTTGDTGLYKTALAAFQSVSSHYAPDKVNSVVLMTDGANTDVNGIDLPTLVATLKASYDPKRPVNITTIALGADADVNALHQISAATGGRTYVVRKAEDIRTVFVQVALRSS
jgi:Ca-activated chloride channel homolog